MLKRPSPLPPPPKVTAGPERYDPKRLAQIRAEQEAQAGVKPPPPAPPPVADAGRLLTGQDRPRSVLTGLPAHAGTALPRRPSPALVEPYDAELAELLTAAATAAGEAYSAATTAAAAQPGGVLWLAAVQAEFAEVHDALDRGKSCPDDSPLYRHVVEVAPRLVVDAWRAQAGAEWADLQAQRRALAISSELSDRCDGIEAQIKARWEQAVKSKDRDDYSGGARLGKEWGEAVSLWRWSLHPDRQYVGGRPALPRSLEFLEYQADLATGGRERISPPLPPADVATLAREFGR